MNRLRETLDDLSARRPPARGAEAVLAGAREVARVRRRRRRAGAVSLGLVVCVAAAALGLPGTDDRDRIDTHDRPSSSTTAPPTTATTAPATTSPPAPTTVAPTVPTQTTVGPVAPAPPAAGRPGPDTTGPRDPAGLVPTTAAEIEARMTPGAVIENVDIVGGNIDVVADDVTIRNFRLDAAGAPYGFRSTEGRVGFVAEDGEIVNTASAGFWGGGATFRRIEVHESDGGAFKPLSGVTIEASWWHHLGRGGAGSANGVQFQGEGGATDVTLRSNVCELPTAAPAGYGSGSCVIVSADAPVAATIVGNWLTGGNYTVDCGDQAGVVVRDNRFGRDHRFGPVTGCPGAAGNLWDDTGTPIG